LSDEWLVKSEECGGEQSETKHIRQRSDLKQLNSGLHDYKETKHKVDSFPSRFKQLRIIKKSKAIPVTGREGL
jgi:hypothetical protein